ncbi:MAG: ribose 5-phosphate isomerase B [Oscillospiraceae bacterium]
MKPAIAIASDGAGYELKKEIEKQLLENGFTVTDFGNDSTASCDYPDYAKPACQAVLDGKCQFALLFCGTGVGMSMAANKMKGIRACCCSDIFSAEMTRLHNNANVLCLGGRVIASGLAGKLVDIFLATEYEGGRHQRRVDKITAIEQES